MSDLSQGLSGSLKAVLELGLQFFNLDELIEKKEDGSGYDIQSLELKELVILQTAIIQQLRQEVQNSSDIQNRLKARFKAVYDKLKSTEE